MSDYYNSDQVDDLYGENDWMNKYLDFNPGDELPAIGTFTPINSSEVTASNTETTEEGQWYQPVVQGHSEEFMASILSQALAQDEALANTQSTEQRQDSLAFMIPEGAYVEEPEPLFDDVNQPAPVADDMVDNTQHGFGTADSSILFAPFGNENYQVASDGSDTFANGNNHAEESSQFASDGPRQFVHTSYEDLMANDPSFEQDTSQLPYQHQGSSINTNHNQFNPEQSDSSNVNYESFEQEQPQDQWVAQNDDADATSFTPEPMAEGVSGTGINNLPTQDATGSANSKALPSWFKQAGLDKQNHNVSAPIATAAQPVSAPKTCHTGTMSSDEIKTSLIKVTGSFAMSVLRATMDAPTRITSQRQLLHVVNSFGLDGNSDTVVPEKLRKSLDGIWTMFNTNRGYQKMFLTYIVEKILKQNPECGPLPLYNGIDFNGALADMACELQAKVDSLDANDPESLGNAKTLLIEEFIHRSHLLEASKVVTQTAVNETKSNYQQALRSKQAEVEAAKARADNLSAQAKKSDLKMQQMELQMKSMQSNIQQLTTNLSGLQIQLTETSSRYQHAHNMNISLLENATPEQIAAASAASSTLASPSHHVSNHQRSQSYPNHTTTPTPAQEFYQPDAPITPPSSKKRKASSASITTGQNFYQCLQCPITKKDKKKEVIDVPEGSICGVINNQVMLGGGPRQRCVNPVCKRYTEIKGKAWVSDETAAFWGVGNQAPLEITMQGADLLNRGGIHYPMNALTAPSSAATPAQEYRQPFVVTNNQQQGMMNVQQFPNQQFFNQQVPNGHNTSYNQQPIPSYDSPYGAQPYNVQPDMSNTQQTMTYNAEPTMTYSTQPDMTYNTQPDMNYNNEPTPATTPIPTSPSAPLFSVPERVGQKAVSQQVQIQRPIAKPSPGRKWPKSTYQARGGMGLTLPSLPSAP
ncbi:hypothetical protein VTL71DRAFT_11142 [Oculimacula yallundae]|uniref:Uncharacterized protein n=1 Tax=Oculimacula yallundae TaxID=86028 RepID=A0ABR4CXB4_9HELO